MIYQCNQTKVQVILGQPSFTYLNAPKRKIHKVGIPSGCTKWTNSTCKYTHIHAE